MMAGRFSVDVQGQSLGKTVLIRAKQMAEHNPFLRGLETMDKWGRQLQAKVNVYFLCELDLHVKQCVQGDAGEAGFAMGNPIAPPPGL